MPQTIVDSLFSHNRELVGILDQSNEVSLRSTADDVFRKVLLLSAASFFEHEIREILIEFVSERTNSDVAVMALVRQKAVERQYHTYFDWEKRNANKFFSLFGSEFADHMKKRVDADESLRESIKAFLELGELRNKLVHLNFATFPLDKTIEEIYALYVAAYGFVSTLSERLRDPILNDQ